MRVDKLEEQSIEHAARWQEEHEEPTPEKLQELAQEDTLEAREELQELAERYDVVYDGGTPSEDLARRITAAIEQQSSDV